MWSMISSLQPIVDVLAPAFSHPSAVTSTSFFLAWVMCLGNRTLFRVCKCANPQTLHDNSRRHGFDSYYNFFERSGWGPSGLAYRVMLLIITRCRLVGPITLLVDDTLVHKRGKSVWGLGWFRDAVASTRKRVATASGHNWVVLAVAICLPLTNMPVFALPVLARLHHKGKAQASCPRLVLDMLGEVLAWFPTARFILVGDGAYASKSLLSKLDPRVTFVGRMRGDAAVYDAKVPPTPSGKRGRKAKKGKRLPSPKTAAGKADRKRSTKGDWVWQEVLVTVYGRQRTLRALAYEVIWPTVLGVRPVRVVVVRDTEGRMSDAYLFTTDLTADVEWVITQFAWRWAIEVLFRASKQVMDIEAPQHWARESVEKLAPWVWSMQSVLIVWYITAGRDLPEAEQLRTLMGEWDTEWSLRHMLQVLRMATLNHTIKPNSADPDQLTQIIETLKNCVILAG
jgi:DDE superfamily endonuclease